MTRTPLLIDLFCNAGGAAMGYHRAGFRVIGVDIDPQPNYPFQFIQRDVAELGPGWIARADAAHASPPCQRYTGLQSIHRNAESHPDMIASTRRLLEASGLPYVIENVPGAASEMAADSVVLCGAMFEGLRVYRHRLFEVNWHLPQPEHPKHVVPCFTYDKRSPNYGRLDDWTAFVTVTGGANSSHGAARDAMGIHWTTIRELAQAIPPAYTEYIGRHLINQVQV